MSDNIKVGLLLDSFWKESNRPPKITPTPSENFSKSEDALALIQEIARRLEHVEGQVNLKADGSKLPSQIILGRDVALIQSDKIGVLGDVTFADYVRDQNGQATGAIDPSVTRIRGGVIQTEQIISGNLSANTGSAFDLDNGNLYIGGSDTTQARLRYENADAELVVRGVIGVEDLGTELGYFSTGGMRYDQARPVGSQLYCVDAAGNETSPCTGVLIGTPGIFGFNNSQQMFALWTEGANAGKLELSGELVTDEYVHARGNADVEFDINFAGTTYDVFASIMGENTANNLGVDDLYAGLMGKVTGENNASTFVAGVVGYAESTFSYATSAVGVLGVGKGFNLGISGQAESGVAVSAVNNSTANPALSCTNSGTHNAIRAENFNASRAAIYAKSSGSHALEAESTSSSHPCIRAIAGSQNAVYGYNNSNSKSAGEFVSTNWDGVIGKGVTGVSGLANDSVNGYGVYCEGKLLSTRRIKSNTVVEAAQDLIAGDSLQASFTLISGNMDSASVTSGAGTFTGDLSADGQLYANDRIRKGQRDLGRLIVYDENTNAIVGTYKYRFTA